MRRTLRSVELWFALFVVLLFAAALIFSPFQAAAGLAAVLLLLEAYELLFGPFNRTASKKRKDRRSRYIPGCEAGFCRCCQREEPPERRLRARLPAPLVCHTGQIDSPAAREACNPV